MFQVKKVREKNKQTKREKLKQREDENGIIYLKNKSSKYVLCHERFKAKDTKFIQRESSRYGIVLYTHNVRAATTTVKLCFNNLLKL